MDDDDSVNDSEGHYHDGHWGIPYGEEDASEEEEDASEEEKEEEEKITQPDPPAFKRQVSD